MSGYRKRPAWVGWAALVLWAVALSMPLQVWAWFGTPPWEWAGWWAKLTAQNRLVLALAALAAVGVGRVARWGWWAAAGFLAAAVLNNAILLRFDTPVPRTAVAGASLLAVAGVGWLVRPATAALFRHPERHWWKTPRRYPVAAPAELVAGPGVWVGRTVDISRTGVFVATVADRLRPGARVRLRLDLGRRVIEGVAEVVRCVGFDGPGPAGVGLRFARVPAADRLWLRARLGALDR